MLHHPVSLVFTACCSGREPINIPVCPTGWGASLRPCHNHWAFSPVHCFNPVYFDSLIRTHVLASDFKTASVWNYTQQVGIHKMEAFSPSPTFLSTLQFFKLGRGSWRDLLAKEKRQKDSGTKLNIVFLTMSHGVFKQVRFGLKKKTAQEKAEAPPPCGAILIWTGPMQCFKN